MIDHVGVFTTGGVVLFSRFLEEETRHKSTRDEITTFIRDTFLSEKSSTEQKVQVNQHIFLYETDARRGLVFLVCYPAGFPSDIFHVFLTNLVEYFEGVMGDVAGQVELANLFLAKGDLWPEVSELLYKSFEQKELANAPSGGPGKPEKKTKLDTKKPESKPKPGAEVKTNTQWDPLMTSSNKGRPKGVDDRLNYNKESGEETVEAYRRRYLEGSEKSESDAVPDASDEEDTDIKMVKPSLFGRFKSSIAKLAEGKALDEKALKPILDSFKEDLIKKNVAHEIADNICSNLSQKLVNSKSDLITSTKTVVKSALKDSITSILTPRNNIDLLAMALKKKEEGRPFVVTFIGVNGVGKSTNLAKVAYLFKTNGFSVLLAACDNFRSGAVEQLKKHAECLEVPIFERGYKDDSANIARDAISEAAQKKIDVVLIDTAGRMQDNEPLMRSLAKLVNSNNPDVVLFIGEALTGNDGVDQLTKFNSALKELSAKVDLGAAPGDKSSGREIDGILLSKFDTVDDKVGAALSLTYATGKPIVYLGVGQKYQNLQKPNIDVVVRSLLK